MFAKLVTTCPICVLDLIKALNETRAFIEESNQDLRQRSMEGLKIDLGQVKLHFYEVDRSDDKKTVAVDVKVCGYDHTENLEIDGQDYEFCEPKYKDGFFETNNSDSNNPSVCSETKIAKTMTILLRMSQSDLMEIMDESESDPPCFTYGLIPVNSKEGLDYRQLHPDAEPYIEHAYSKAADSSNVFLCHRVPTP